MAKKKKDDVEVVNEVEMEMVQVEPEEEISIPDPVTVKEDSKIQTVADLPGVGPATLDKLEAANYTTLESIAVASPAELVEVAGLGEGMAARAINAARQTLEMGYETADQILQRRVKIGKIQLGSKEFNELLGGGVETQCITEVYGKFGSSKTQIAFQLSVMVQKPQTEGGLGGNVLYIDSENSFRPERVMDIARAQGIDPEAALKNIFVARAYNADHQMILAEKAAEIVKEKNIKLVIVDSLTAKFRAEYVGRGKLADRQQKLNKHMHVLERLAEMNNLAVLVTNQVMSRPDILFGDPTAPIGGNVVGHTSKVRVYLRKSKGDKRIARLVDSPNLPDGEAVYRITENGIED